MKKLILLLFLFAIGTSAFAQINQIVTPQTKLQVVKGAHLISPLIRPHSDDFQVNTDHPIVVQHTGHNLVNTGGLRDFTSTVMGSTIYDVQTNGSISTRLWNNGGKLSAVWLYSNGSPPAYTDRGTGYNYYNGIIWDTLPTARVESQRTGYPNIVVNGSGGEVISAHNTVISQMQETWRNAQGTGAWTENASNLASTAVKGNLWSKASASGNNIHVISSTTPTGALQGAIYHGQDGALLYSRSTDGGQTWGIQNEILPGIDSSSYTGFSADEYQIDANGSTVAIIVGDNTTDMVLLKSTDNGANWTKTIVWQFPVPFYDGTSLLDITGDGVADTVLTTDATPAVLVDDQGMAHVWFGAMFVINEGAGLFVFPGTNALLYWDETMGTDSSILCAESRDLDGSGTLDITDFGRFGNEGICSGPSPGIDANGTLYITYSAVVENTSDGVGCDKNVRHTYVSFSEDNGQTWSPGKDISPDPLLSEGVFSESVYGAMARTVDDNVNVIFQQDFFAGTAVATDAAGNQFDPCNVPGAPNDIVHVQLPVLDLTGIMPVGTKDHKLTVYPNPSDGIINVAMNSSLSGKASIDIMNTMGQVVKRFREVPIVSNVTHLNVSDLDNGMYYLTVTNKNETSVVTFNITR